MYICVIVIRGPRVHQSLTGSFIYTLGRAPRRTTTTECTPMLCMALFHNHLENLGETIFYCWIG